MKKGFERNPLLPTTLIFIVGILCARYISTYHIIFWFSILLLLVYVIYSNLSNLKLFYLNVLLCILIASAGALRYHISADILPQGHLSTFKVDDIKSITGIIQESHYRRDNRNKYILRIHGAFIAGIDRKVKGKVLLQTRNLKSRLPFGAVVQLKGKLQQAPDQRNPGQFNYRSYLASKDIYHLIQINNYDSLLYLDSDRGDLIRQHLILPIKQYCEQKFLFYLEENTCALLRALLLGEKQDLDPAMVRQFQEVGVVHVLAISGLHVGFIIAFVLSILSLIRIPGRYRIYALILILGVYVTLVQFKPPVLRASLMTILFLMGKLHERRVSAYNIVFGSAFIILVIDPKELFNPGFQFSFVAVLSIIYGYKKLNSGIPMHLFFPNKDAYQRYIIFLRNWIWKPFLVSLAAVLGTLPLTLYYYGLLPLLAIFSNLLIIPIIAIIVFLGIFLLICASFSVSLAHGIGMLIDNVQVLLKSVVKTISNIPFASYETKMPSIIEIVLIMIIVFILFNFKRICLKKFMIGSGIIAVVYLFKFSIEAPRNFEVTFLDVGQGDAHFLHFPNGNTMLIDAGVANIYWDNGLNTILPFLKYKGILHLNYLVCSHPHDDHIGGIFALLNRIRIDTIVVSPYKFNSELYENLINLCAKKHIPLKHVQRGDQLYPDRSCRVYVLHPNAEFSRSDSYDGSECNNSSLVLKVQYGNIGILFTGDLERTAEQSVLCYKQFLESEIIKVAHHGSNTSTSTEFLTQIQPLVSVISVAKKNKFRHPSEKTLQRLGSYAVKNFLTSKEGAIVFEITPNLIKKIKWK